MNWLENLVVQHSELESPESFWYWAGAATISAVIKDNVWLSRQIYDLYPNIYVMLHADSGLKKGPPVAMARRLVTLVNNTKIIGGRSSIQGILKDLGTGQGYTLPGGKVVKNDKSVAFICSSELSSSIVEDKVAIKILTDLYDRQYNLGEWRSLLKMESFTLKDPTISMLTATNEAMTEDFFTRSAIQGGYFARTFIVYEQFSANINSLSVPLANPPNLPVAAEYLKKLSTLKGQFEPLGSRTENDTYRNQLINPRTGIIEYYSDAGLTYEEWYRDFRSQATGAVDPTGTLNRFGDSVLKVAMLLSLAREPTLTITVPAMEEAITKCRQLLGNVRQTTLGAEGTSQSKSMKTFLIKEMMRRDDHRATRTVLMNLLMMHYKEASEFDEIVNSLEQAGTFKFEHVGNHILIVMPDAQVQKYQRMFEGKEL